jgi:hypothetical protein
MTTEATTLDDLRRRAWAARDELMLAETAEKNRSNASLLGKCFVARTSYSCPDGPLDYWPLYGMVLAAEDGGLRMLEFQRDKYGKYEIETSVHRASLFTGYREITKQEFQSAWQAILSEMTASANTALGVADDSNG